MTLVLIDKTRKECSIHNTLVILFLLLCIVITITKLTLFLDFQSTDFLGLLLFLNIIELSVWLLISKIYYKGEILAVGLVIVYVVMATYVIVPLTLLISDFEIFPFKLETIKTALLAQSISLSFLYPFIHLFNSKDIIKKAAEAIYKNIKDLFGLPVLRF